MSFGTQPFGAAPFAAESGGSVGALAELVRVESGCAAVKGFIASLSESVTANSVITAMTTLFLAESVTARDTIAQQIAYKIGLLDVAKATDAVVFGWYMLIAEQVMATDSVAGVRGMISRLIDTAVASGVCANTWQAKTALIEAVFALDTVNRDFPTSLTEAATARDELAAQLAAVVALVEDVSVTDTVANQVNVTMFLDETVTVSDVPAAMLAAFESLTETVYCALSLQLGAESYTAVVINTESKAVSEYLNFPLDLMPYPFGGRYLGVTDDGIYELTGSTDDGAAIDSFIRTGLAQIADGHRARIPMAWIGYTATGALVMKVITTDHIGGATENWYRLEARQNAAPVAGRVKIGRRLAPVYAGFELHSIDGSAFGVDTIRLRPMKLSRRFSQ